MKFRPVFDSPLNYTWPVVPEEVKKEILVSIGRETTPKINDFLTKVKPAIQISSNATKKRSSNKPNVIILYS
jgi:hypothetical protein